MQKEGGHVCTLRDKQYSVCAASVLMTLQRHSLCVFARRERKGGAHFQVLSPDLVSGFVTFLCKEDTLARLEFFQIGVAEPHLREF